MGNNLFVVPKITFLGFLDRLGNIPNPFLRYEIRCIKNTNHIFLAILFVPKHVTGLSLRIKLNRLKLLVIFFIE